MNRLEERNENKFKVYHPITHIMIGETLYIFQLSFRGKFNECCDLVEQCFKKHSEMFEISERSYCMYEVFGKCDLFIRIWIRKEYFEKVENEIKSIPRLISCRVLECNRMSTWVQRKIDDKLRDEKGDVYNFDEIFRTDLNRLKIYDRYCLLGNDNYNRNKKVNMVIKYFMCIDARYYDDDGLYFHIERTCRDIAGCLGKWSLYEVIGIGDTYKGFILKCTATNTYDLRESYFTFLESVAKPDLEIHTLISARKPIKEGDDPNIEIIATKYRNDVGAIKRDAAISFLKINSQNNEIKFRTISNILQDDEIQNAIYAYTRRLWWEFIVHLQKLNMWILSNDSWSAISFLMRSYAEIENTLRSQIVKIFKYRKAKNIERKQDEIMKWKIIKTNKIGKAQIMEKLNNQKKILGRQDGDLKATIDVINNAMKYIKENAPDELILTMGTISQMISIILDEYEKDSRDENNDTEKWSYIRSQQKRLTNSSEDRNNVMHGTIDDVFAQKKFKGDASKEIIWKRFLKNYILFYPYYLYTMKILIEMDKTQFRIDLSEL